MGDARFVKISLIIACTAIWFCLTETRSSVRSRNCPRYLLNNGVAIYKGLDRIAKFTCNRGYVLVGSRHSTCMRGQWNRPIPVCASPTGCDPLVPPSQGFLLSRYGNAVMNYKCNPGYSLIGSSTAYCDGSRWNVSSAACVPSVQSPARSCDFEQPSLCDWSQDTRDYFDWRRNRNGVDPSYDHTYGKENSGYYIKVSATRRITGTARLYSPVFQPDYAYSCFTFWYYMRGSTNDSLRVYIKKDDEDFSKIQPLWQRDGEQGNEWLKGAMPIPTLHRSFQVIIEGVHSASFLGDTAIDDVSLQLESCEASVNKTDSSIISPTLTSPPDSDVTPKSTRRQLPVAKSTSAGPIISKSTPSIDLFASTSVSQKFTPITSQSVTNVITSSQFGSGDGQTSSIASTAEEEPDEGNSTSISGTKYWNRTQRPKSPSAQVSKAPSKGVLAGAIIIPVFLLTTGIAAFIYFKKYRLNRDKQPEESDLRYLAGSDEIEYVDSYDSSDVLN